MAQKTEQYRLENLSCANCAAKFERNVREIKTVEEVQLNFGAAKLTVTGQVTVEQLEQAGAFDGIKVSLAKDRKVVKSEPFYKRKENQLAMFSLFFRLLMAYRHKLLHQKQYCSLFCSLMKLLLLL